MAEIANPAQYRTRFPAISAPIDASVQRQNAGYLAPGQNKLAVNLDKVVITSNQTFNLPSPGPGKTWLITDIYLSHDSTSALRFALLVGGITVWSAPVKGDTAPIVMPGIETQIEVQEGQSFQLFCTGAASTNAYANITGVEQAIGPG